MTNFLKHDWSQNNKLVVPYDTDHWNYTFHVNWEAPSVAVRVYCAGARRRSGSCTRRRWRAARCSWSRTRAPTPCPCWGSLSCAQGHTGHLYQPFPQQAAPCRIILLLFYISGVTRCYYVWTHEGSRTMVIVTAAIVALVIDINLTTTAAVAMMGPPTVLQHSILHVVVYSGNKKKN